jgi:NTP pyrophosphatase (non-canonical NTP hydrolase)
MSIKELPIDTRLIQLAEEAAELSQAAIKYVRVLRGETPVTKDEALENLTEELADVSVCMTAVNDLVPLSGMVETITDKVRRWEDRLDGKTVL